MTRLAVHAVHAARMWACLPVVWLGLAIMPRRMRIAALKALSDGFDQAVKQARVDMLHQAAADQVRRWPPDIRPPFGQERTP